MKISKDTIQVLKSFADINENLLIKAGNSQRTIALDQGVLAVANFAEDFPSKAPIVNLKQFLANVESLEDPDVEFEEKLIVISDASGSKMQFPYGSEKLITSAPDKDLLLTDEKQAFTLTTKQALKITKFAGINLLPMITIGNDGIGHYIKAEDPKNPDSAIVRISIDTVAGDQWFETFKTERFVKLLSEDYAVSFVAKAFVVFTSPKVTYFVASEK